MNRWVTRILWGLYAALLAVTVPHVSWTFQRFEPAGAVWIGWAAAVAFEGSIAAFTWRYKEVLESVPKYKKPWVRFRRRYLNWPAVGLLVALVVSSAANFAHAEEFGRSMAIFARHGISPTLYSLMFGGILPACSFLFAHIIADTVNAEADTDPELERAKKEVADLRRELREAERRIAAAEARTAEAEGRFAAAGDLFARLMAESKRERILAAAERWPALPPAAVAIIAGASPSYVSEVLSGALD